MTGQRGNFFDTTDVEWYAHINGGSITVSGIGEGKVIFINNVTADTFVMNEQEWESLKAGIENEMMGE